MAVTNNNLQEVFMPHFDEHGLDRAYQFLLKITRILFFGCELTNNQ